MTIDKDLTSVQQARDLVEAAHSAQKIFATFNQERVDAIVDAMAGAALADKDRLGQLAVEETGYGVAKDKAEKNRFSAQDIHNFFHNLKTVGVINETEQIIEIADPRGVVAAIIPSTNPTSTAIFKVLIALKSRNGIVLSPHPSAAMCIGETVRIMREAAEAAGAPAGLIGCQSVATLTGTEELMKHKHTAVILATGGIGLVRAAYSSGKPAFGVGPGNVPVLVERSADLSKAVADIITGKTFDYGTICASEQAVVAESVIDKQVRAEFLAQGAYFCNAAETEKLERLIVLPTRGLNPKVVGKSPQVIAEMAGFSLPADVRVLMVEPKGVGREHPLSIEKLSPVLAYYTVENWQIGSSLCDQILHFGGMGHTVGIHSRNRDIVRQFGLHQPAARIIVNSPTTHGAIGLSTNLPPSMTLGCGSWGGNVTSDNVSPLHLMDIKRIAFETRPVTRVSSNITAKPAIATADLAARIAAQVIEQTRARAAVLQTAVEASQTTASAGVPIANTPTTLNDEAIANLVDRFLAERKLSARATPITAATSPSTPPPSMTSATPLKETVVTKKPDAAASISNANSATMAEPTIATSEINKPVVSTSSNGHRAADFVCEEDVRRAIRDRQKIHISAKTIITPSARDLGESNEVFAKV
ncbi:MAG: aldehyde dehydrogenase family protein [Acidobacteriota bacterium]